MWQRSLARPFGGSRALAPSSRRRIPIFRQRMIASRCCGRSTLQSARPYTCGTIMPCSSRSLPRTSKRARALTMQEIERAETQRVAMTARMLAFFETYVLLLTPATIVAPFPVEQRYVAQCAGHKFDNYVEWLAIAYAVTLCCCPALSLPCGFTREELPVGLQIVAPPRAEVRVLLAAKLLEDILGLRGMTPILPRVPAVMAAAAS